MDRLIAIFVVLLGVNFLMDNFGLPKIEFGDLKKLWPLVLIWVGWTMWREAGHKRS
ncbi:hypothetical protein KKG45_07060 [bacterium]|nr:hypothetical protein [bacterium]MBU1072989.1 hypothetical protein [bacterium]MBU1676199.1 hypothetical protein [bacterium]